MVYFSTSSKVYVSKVGYSPLVSVCNEMFIDKPVYTFLITPYVTKVPDTVIKQMRQSFKNLGMVYLGSWFNKCSCLGSSQLGVWGRKFCSLHDSQETERGRRGVKGVERQRQTDFMPPSP